jgi:transcriptional regulator with XRE-family HTH domain
MITVITDEQAKAWIAANVTRLMKDRGLTQVDIANITGEQQMRIWRLANGLHLPSSAVIKRVAEALETTVDELMSEPSLVET